MKLFKNGVGRPSNEILRKRRTVYGLIIGCIAIMLFIGAYALSSFNAERLSGAVANNTLEIRNTTVNSFDIYWTSKKGIRTFTVYSSNSKGQQGKRIGYHSPKSNTANKGSWRYGKGGTNANKISSDSYYLVIAKFKDGTTLKRTAKTLANTYVVKFISTGGTTGTMANQTIPYGGSTPLRANAYKATDGSKFEGWIAWRSQDSKWYGYDKNGKLGWYDDSSFTKLYVYKDKERVGKTANPGTYVNMYTVWESKPQVKTYVVKYNANGGTGTMKDQTITFGGSTALRTNTFTRKGYKFVGWKAWRSEDSWYGYNKAGKLGWHKAADISRYYIYKNNEKVGKTTPPGTYAVMYAMWTKSSTTTKTQPQSSSKYQKPTGKENGISKYTIFVASVCQEDATGYKGAKWVVDTIFNRVDDNSTFKNQNTPWAVLTAKSQFESYGSKHYKKRLDKNGALKSECNNAKRAVDDAFANPKNRAHKYKYFLAYRKYKSDVKVGDNYYRSKY